MSAEVLLTGESESNERILANKRRVWIMSWQARIFVSRCILADK